MVIISLIDCLEDFDETNRAINTQWLAALLSLRSRARSKKKRRKPAHVLEVKMANPNCIEINPIKFLPGDTMRRVSAYVEEYPAAFIFQPIAGSAATCMRN